jgi:hypothetical protein
MCYDFFEIFYQFFMCYNPLCVTTKGICVMILKLSCYNRRPVNKGILLMYFHQKKKKQNINILFLKLKNITNQVAKMKKVYRKSK